MEVLGDDQRANLAAILRQGATKAPVYGLPNIKGAVELGGNIMQGYDDLKEKGEGSAFEGLKGAIGMGTPDLGAKIYNDEFGKYDPQFQATMPKDPNAQDGMFGGMGNTMSGWFK
jgi:hypothetical protein